MMLTRMGVVFSGVGFTNCVLKYKNIDKFFRLKKVKNVRDVTATFRRFIVTQTQSCEVCFLS